MPILVDTNILIRSRDLASPQRSEFLDVLTEPIPARHELVTCSQVLIEYWAATTRPRGRQNGLGLTPAEADLDLTRFLRVLPCTADPDDIFARWRSLVTRHGVSGRPTHDARLVALMDAYGITQFLTLNAADFARYGHIDCLTPRQLLTQ